MFCYARQSHCHVLPASTIDNNQDANDYGVPANFTFLPAVLKHSAARYRTHGKTHVQVFSNKSVFWDCIHVT